MVIPFTIWGAQSLVHEEFCLEGYNGLYRGERQPTFLSNLSPLSSCLKNNPSTKPAWSRQQEKLLRQLMSVDFQRSWRRYILKIELRILRRLLGCDAMRLQLLVTANAVPSFLILFTLIMEAIRSYETSILTRSTRRHIPEGGTLHTRRREKLRSCIVSYSPVRVGQHLRDYPPLCSSGQSSWIQSQRSRVRLSALSDCLSSNGSETGSTQLRQIKWRATWKNNNTVREHESSLENQYKRPWGVSALTTRLLYPRRSQSRYSSLADEDPR
jgi:hypothetical protein